MNTKIAKIASAALLSLLGVAHADVITDWNDKANEIVAKVGPGAAGHRLMAVVQGAVLDAVNGTEPRAPVEAAIAAANRATLAALVPAEKAAVEAAYQRAVEAVPESEAKARAIAAGERAAAQWLARAAADGANAPDRYQWNASPGRYVPTVTPAAASWPNRKPWVMDKASQFRPGPPPELGSETWVRDLQEVRTYGEKGSKLRTPQQTEVARFWEETRPLVYFPLLRSVAALPGRTVAQNARLYAASALASDDALIAVFDAKYHYQFWRPVTAVRSTHAAGGTTVEGDAGWTPLIPTPMHPEYPCAHCVIAGAVGAVIDAELRGAKAPLLRTTSPTAPGVVREWKSAAEMVEEVKTARIHDGVHYRNSTQVGAEMGAAVGRLVQQRLAAAASL
jgi:PAP2 superfamily